MATKAPRIYAETRLSPTPALPSSILTINTGNTTQQLVPFGGAGRKRAFNEISGLDENAYAQKYLATEGSVFFRRKSRSPRSFLWRVLEDRKLLEIQCVDLVQDRKQKEESWLTFHVRFDHAILDGGVAFADPEETDALEVFALTAGHELFTVTLRRNLLTREEVPKDFDASACWKRYASVSFSLRHPYRLHAVTSMELVVSLHDGSLMQLNREAKQSGLHWREALYVEGGWSGTLRGWIPVKRQQTVRYGNLDLEPIAAAGIAKSPDQRHIWTVCLDHTIRVWDTQTGKVVKSLDMVEEQEPEEGRTTKRPQYLMSAEQGTLLRIVEARDYAAKERGDNTQYCLAVHSPRDHRFKFYDVSTVFSSMDGERLEVKELMPKNQFIPPIDELLNTNIWHLADFFYKPDKENYNNKLWIRARSGALCKTFVVNFGDFTYPLEVEDWQRSFTMVDSGHQTSEELRKCADFPPGADTTADSAVTPSERWMGFLFVPGRFSVASLEAALHVYRKARGVSAPASKGINAAEAPLEERLALAISSKILLRRSPDDQPDYAGYQASINAQWQTYYSLLSHLHDRRCESVGLAYDEEDELAWHVCADFVAPIRACSALEKLELNAHLYRDQDAWDCIEFEVQRCITSRGVGEDTEVWNAIALMTAARDFRANFTASFKTDFHDAAIAESCQEIRSLKETAQTLDRLYRDHGFAREVTNEEFDLLADAAVSFGGLQDLKTDDFMTVLEMLNETAQNRSGTQDKVLDRYGDRFTIAVAQETLQHAHLMLMDLLVLIVFMNGDLETDELDEEFRAPETFRGVMHAFRKNQLMLWLVTNSIQQPCRRKRGRDQMRQSMQDEVPEDTISLTVAESVFMSDWDTRACGDDQSTPGQLTVWSKAWTYGVDLDKNWNGITNHIMADLLKHKHLDLAADFESFLADSRWSSYLKGRLHTAAGDYASASVHYKSAADELAAAKDIATHDTANLLRGYDREDFGNGMTKYFQHISSIFEQLRNWSYTAEFAALAFHHLNAKLGDDFDARLSEIDMRKSNKGSPAMQQLDDVIEETHILRLQETRDEILCRLFNALVQTARFEEAFHALARLGNPALKKSSLDTLIKKCAETDCVSLLRALPFEDNDLDELADSILLQLAKRSFALNSASSPPYHQIIFAYRVDRDDYRGASEILYERLERLRYKESHYLQNPDDETLVEAYLILINTMACCGDGEGWLLAEPIAGVHTDGRKRKLVTIEQVRGDYEKELDRRSDVAYGRFPLTGLVGTGDGDEDVEML